MEAALIPVDEIALRILRFENSILRAHEGVVINRQGAEHTLADLHPSKHMGPTCSMLEGPVRYFIKKSHAKLEGHLVIEPDDAQRYQVLNGHLLVEWGGLAETVLMGLVGKTLDDLMDIGPYQSLITGLKITGYEDGIMQKLLLHVPVHNAGWLGDPRQEDSKRRKAGTWPL